MNSRLADVVNISPVQFAQTPVNFLRNPEVSAVSKSILGLLLSNTEGWTSYKSGIQSCMKEGRESIDKALKTIEEYGYLLRIQLCDIETKQNKKAIWGITNDPYCFNIEYIEQLAEQEGLEIWSGTYKKLDNLYKNTSKKPLTGKPYYGKPRSGIPTPKYINSKIDKNINTLSSCADREKECFKKRKRTKWNSSPEKITNQTSPSQSNQDNPSEVKSEKAPRQELNPSYYRLAARLENAVASVNKITKGSRTGQWPDIFRKLHVLDKVDIKRIRHTLIWYEQHIGEKYIPECYSAQSFREKFFRLESAKERSEKQSEPVTKLGGAKVIPGKYAGMPRMVYDGVSAKWINC